jgi:hypothetical protein
MEDVCEAGGLVIVREGQAREAVKHSGVCEEKEKTERTLCRGL